MNTQGQGGDTHRCDFCEEPFATRAELERHVKEQHGDVLELSVPDGTGGSRTKDGAGMVQSE